MTAWRTTLLLAAAACAAACARTTAPGPATAAPDTPADTTPPHGAVRFTLECFDFYAECEPVEGLPAVSADGTRVAVADTGPDTARDEVVLTVRILELASGRELSASPIVTLEDYGGQVATEYGLPDALARTIAERARSMEATLARDGYQPLPSLGMVHEDRAGDDAPGLAATFDGTTLVVRDTRTGAALWQQAVGPSRPFLRGDGETCGPFPVAYVSVWARREPPAAVARVFYIGADLCPTEFPYVVLR